MNQSYVQQTWGRWDPLRVQQSGEMSSLDVDKMRVVDLRQALKERGLNTSGKKAEMQERLRTALEQEHGQEDGQADEGDEDGKADKLETEEKRSEGGPEQEKTLEGHEPAHKAGEELGKGQEEGHQESAHLRDHDQEATAQKGHEAVEEQDKGQEEGQDESAHLDEHEQQEPQEAEGAEHPKGYSEKGEEAQGKAEEEPDKHQEAKGEQRGNQQQQQHKRSSQPEFDGTPSKEGGHPADEAGGAPSEGVEPSAKGNDYNNKRKASEEAAGGSTEERTAKRVKVEVRGEPAQALRIENFERGGGLTETRTVRKLREYGNIREGDFMMSKLKDHCYVVYSSPDEAVKCAESLHGAKWPMETATKSLTVTPISVDEAREAISGQAGQFKSRPAVQESDQTIDDLFNRTSAKPRLYWLPASGRRCQIAKS